MTKSALYTFTRPITGVIYHLTTEEGSLEKTAEYLFNALTSNLKCTLPNKFIKTNENIYLADGNEINYCDYIYCVFPDDEMEVMEIKTEKNIFNGNLPSFISHFRIR